MSSQYPKDEFDHAGEDMPIGMHRPQPSKWRAVWPFLVILIVVPLLGWGVSQLLTSRGILSTNDVTTQSVSTQQSAAQSATGETPAATEQSTSAAQSSAEEAPAEETPAEETEPVRYGARIAVLNGAGIQGYASEQAGILAAEGFQGTSAANADGWTSEVSTVYYEDPALESTAREVARILGIDAVENSATYEDDIVVVLR